MIAEGKVTFKIGMEVDSIITAEGVIGEEYQEMSEIRDKR